MAKLSTLEKEIIRQRERRLEPFKVAGPIVYGLVCQVCGYFSTVRAKEPGPAMRCPVCSTADSPEKLWLKMEFKPL